jgi:urease accessory protein
MKMMTGSRLLALLHLCDSLFPIGGFGYSDGLESATTSGAIADAGDLRAWIDVCLAETIGRLEGPTLLRGWTVCHDRSWDGLAELDQEFTALRPSSTARRASSAMGLRLVTTWQTLYPDQLLSDVVSLARAGAIGPALPVAFAVACVSAGVDRRASAEAFAYTRLASTISAAMRLMPIGQTDAHRLLADVLCRVPAAVEAMAARDGRAESFAPAMDLAAMTQQYLHSRLFRS